MIADFAAFAREAGISHQAVNLRAGIRVRGAVHVQNVNAYHSRLRGWLSIFHGVATLESNAGRVPTPDGDIAILFDTHIIIDMLVGCRKAGSICMLVPP